MLITLTLKKNLKKIFYSRMKKNYCGHDTCVVNVLDFSILSKHCKFMLQGEK